MIQIMNTHTTVTTTVNQRRKTHTYKGDRVKLRRRQDVELISRSHEDKMTYCVDVMGLFILQCPQSTVCTTLGVGL